jgi:hypothetical protein
MAMNIGQPARNIDGELSIFDRFPMCGYGSFFGDDITNRIELPEELFPEITFEDSPIRVKLTLEILKE